MVAGAIVCDSRLLVAQRDRPAELAGYWELPGGKVVVGETERDALARELAEELGLKISDIAVGDRLGNDMALNDNAISLRAYVVRLLRGVPRACDHRALRWVTATELSSVDWVPADRAWLADLARVL